MTANRNTKQKKLAISREIVITEELVNELIKKFPKKITNQEIENYAVSVGKINIEKLRKKIKEKLTSQYRDEITRINLENPNFKITFGEPDKNIIETVINNPNLTISLSKFENIANKKINQLIIDGLSQGYGIKEITDTLNKVIDITEAHAKTIARTETHTIQTLARDTSYSKVKEPITFQWIGPQDRRTTSICRKIKQRTQKGVSREELIQIIKDEADPNFYNPVNPFSPHFNCRHVQVRKIN